MGSDEDSVGYSQQLVQLNFTTVGPYDDGTLVAMNLAAESLMALGNYDESIKILCLMLQLQERCKQESGLGICIGLRNLALALLGQKHYKDARTIL